MEAAVVKLIIKAPNQQIKDQIVECDVGWTVGRLKEHLAEVYPSKPETTSQKLIYSGQLLNDPTCLKDVLRQCDGLEDQSYTVHLVCASQKMCAKKTTSKQVTENVVPDTRSAGEQHIRLNNANNVQNMTQDNVNVVTQHNPTQLYSTHQYFDPRNSQQMAWIQQAYTHYFTQYMQLMAAQGIQLQTGIPDVQQMNLSTNDSVQNPYTNNANNNVGDEQPQPAAQNAADVNAGNNNGAVDDGAFNRDWLDLFYMLSRIMVLFSIVFFYSSPLRFFIVTFVGFAIYLYQGGYFRVQPIVLYENNNGRADNNNQVLQNEAGGAQAVQQQNGQAATAEGRTNANDEQEEERPGALAFTWTFFSTFFASLIPDQPNVI